MQTVHHRHTPVLLLGLCRGAPLPLLPILQGDLLSEASPAMVLGIEVEVKWNFWLTLQDLWLAGVRVLTHYAFLFFFFDAVTPYVN